jgi:hypothetical protein
MIHGQTKEPTVAEKISPNRRARQGGIGGLWIVHLTDEVGYTQEPHIIGPFTNVENAEQWVNEYAGSYTYATVRPMTKPGRRRRSQLGRDDG